MCRAGSAAAGDTSGAGSPAAAGLDHTVIRRRYPLVARLERVDRELSDSVRFFGILTEDIIGARGMAIDAAERLTGVVALVGCLLLVAGADSRLVGPWLIAMAADGAVEEATGSADVSSSS